MRYKFLRYPGGRMKAVTLSYDDGSRHDIRFIEKITGCGLKSTFNLNSYSVDEISGEGCLSREEIEKYILGNGHEVAVHGAQHTAPGLSRPIDGIRDMLQCRLELEKKLGIIIRGMAYPDSGICRIVNNTSYEEIRNYLKSLDIVYGRSASAPDDSFMLPTDWLNWIPTVQHSSSETLELIDRFLARKAEDYTAHNVPLLFFLWGHSSEFEGDNNWELLDEICDRLAGHDDIWYATNMELYKYVEAYNSLEFSADGTIIHNPTAQTVWLSIDDRGYELSSGETLKI